MSNGFEVGTETVGASTWIDIGFEVVDTKFSERLENAGGKEEMTASVLSKGLEDNEDDLEAVGTEDEAESSSNGFEVKILTEV